MNDPKLPPLATWLTEPLPKDVAQSLDRLRRTDDVRHIAVMPDVHLAADICVGTVLATRELVYPAAIGGDIGCGMAAVAIDASAVVLADERSAIALLRGLAESVPSLKHAAKRELPRECDPADLSAPSLAKAADRDGRLQFGTLGRGNHFLEFQRDADGRLWTMLHSGSRAMGQCITRYHLDRAATPRAHLIAIDVTSPRGRDYLHDVAWARAYAAANRLAMLRGVDALLQRLFHVSIDWPTLIHRDHNHVERETHFGESLLVHRKGAQSALADAPALIPGSMGTASFHVTGRGHAPALASCSHGAGRRLSRTDAARTLTARDVQRQMSGVHFNEHRAAALRDEAPAAYKDIRRVMRAQRDLVRITRELHPVLSYKGV
jgi:tRNA-splicing ligase RtcB